KIIMSNSTESSPIVNQQIVSPPKDKSSEIIAHTVPISTVPAQSLKKNKAKSSTVKKEKPSKVSESIPSSASIKNPKSKGKKSKTTAGPRKALTMTDLYLKDNPFESSIVESNVDTSVKDSTFLDVGASAK
ncbi:hypothetical protein A2U01_0057292, partial [Trifolium medium]|nr:hypothetical protein [Trifolium medium]